VLDLRHPELDLLELVARHEPELAEQPCEAGAGPFAEAHCLIAPAAHDLFDDRPGLVTADPATSRKLLRQRVCPLSGQRDGADPGEMQPGGLMIAMQEGVPVIPCGLDTFGWSPTNRRKCAVVWGEPMRVDDLPRNRKGYAEAADRVGAEIVRLWRQAAEACAAGLPSELPDGAKRSGINPKLRLTAR